MANTSCHGRKPLPTAIHGWYQATVSALVGIADKHSVRPVWGADFLPARAPGLLAVTGAEAHRAIHPARLIELREPGIHLAMAAATPAHQLALPFGLQRLPLGLADHAAVSRSRVRYQAGNCWACT